MSCRMQSAKNLQKLEELTLLKVRLWLVLEYFRNGNFREFWYWAGEFSSFWTGIPGGPVQNDVFYLVWIKYSLIYLNCGWRHSNVCKQMYEWNVNELKWYINVKTRCDHEQTWRIREL